MKEMKNKKTPSLADLDERPELEEADYSYKNVGWSLGNACPLHCRQCYSRITRESNDVLDRETIDKIIGQLNALGVKTINLGGNEPIYTNGLDPQKSLLPHVIDSVTEKGILVGLTTSGITLLQLERRFPGYLKKINDVDISIDSPREEEHDHNRQQKGIFQFTIKALEICERYAIPKSIIMCGMNWNFTEDRLNEMIDLAIKYKANFRINPIKPTESEQMDLVLSPEQFYQGLAVILRRCDPIDLSDPAWASASKLPSEMVSGCPCGVSSFRIHSITADGKIPVSPCVYLNDYKYGDLKTQNIKDILDSIPFRVFRRRKANPEAIEGCRGCPDIAVCGGGCASRVYLHQRHKNKEGKSSLFEKDPYCPQEYAKKRTEATLVDSKHKLVHEGYLCTGIFLPRNNKNDEK